jgi:hypothetical protein
MRPYIALECIEQKFEVFHSCVHNWDGNGRSHGKPCGMVLKLHPDTAKVVWHFVNILLLADLCGNSSFLPLARWRENSGHDRVFV